MPARHLLPLGRYRALGMPVSMTTSRGCPFQCIFCVGRKMAGSRVRRRDPVLAVDELEYLSSLDFHQVNIADDLFTANRKHCLAICDEIDRRKLEVNWTAFARVDTVSPEILNAMKNAGCSAVSFGVESGNAKMLEKIKKNITTAQVLEAVKMCGKAGIIPHASFILGLPGETPKTLRETIDFGEKIKEMGASHGFHLLAPFPGTRVREDISRYDIKILTNDWSKYHANRAVVETPFVTKRMLDDIIIGWEKKFDEWLGKIEIRRAAGKADEKEAWPLVRLEHTVLIYEMMMKNVIEKKGSWRADNMPFSEKEALKTLEKKIGPFVGAKSDQLQKTLKFALDLNCIEFFREDEFIRCKWINFLQTKPSAGSS